MNRSDLISEIAQVLEPWAWETKSYNATIARDDAMSKAEQIVDLLPALSLPITQRDQQGDRAYADGIADAAKVADQEADDIKQHSHLASDAWQQGREAMARTIATAIRRLSIEQDH